MATVQLERWQGELSRTLLQLSADAQFRARIADRNQIDPQWYRRKALALISAMEKIRQDLWWTVFIPGSWYLFDDLEERLAQRMEREFSDIVLETIRRELFARAARLTRTPVAQPEGSFREPISCSAPDPDKAAPAAAPGEPAGRAALRAYLTELSELDAAVTALRALQQDAGKGGGHHLRRLVRYTLDAELPGPATRSLALFAGRTEAAGAPPDATVSTLQAAARCAFLEGVRAVDAQLLARNQLVSLERSIQEHLAPMHDAKRSEAFVPAVQRYRSLHQLLQQQDQVLARGGTAWMKAGSLETIPEQAQLLAQAAGVGLLGPDVVQQAQEQSAAAFAQFRRQFDALFSRTGSSGLAWDEGQGRFVMSPDRVAMRDALGLLLRQPFMQVLDDGSVAPAPASLEEALSVADTRRRVRRDVLPRFPAAARGQVGRMVDGRLATLAHDAAANAIRAAVTTDFSIPLDTASVRAQKAKVAQVQALLAGMGAPDLAQRLSVQQTAELGARLTAAQELLKTLPIFQPSTTDFRTWRGEPAPLLRALGVNDAGSLQNLLADQSRKLDAWSRLAEPYLAAGDTSLLANPAAQRWQRLSRELERYRAFQPDSSLVFAERYLTSLAPTLHRENCAEILAAQSPPRHDDDVAQRVTEMHNALLARCIELRSELGKNPGPTGVQLVR